MDENKDNLSFENLTEEAVLKIKPKKKKIVLDISETRAIISVFGSRRRYSSVGRATDL